MSLEAENFVWRLQGVKPNHKFVLLAIARHVGRRSSSASVTRHRLMLDTCMGRETLRRNILEMGNANLLTMESRASSTNSNTYTLIGFNGMTVKEATAIAEKLDASFELFWHEYPRKEKKKDAYRAWVKLRPNPDLAKKITGYVTQRASRDWTRDNLKYIPLATSFLNGERWNDEMPAQEKGGNDTVFDGRSYDPRWL